VITRLVFFAVTCGALLTFRRRAGPAPFTVPGGPVVPVLGIVFCVYLLSTRTLAEAWQLPILVLAAALLWHLNRRRQRAIAAA
jgi:APA family basic amino acid/polyamine antiporter